MATVNPTTHAWSWTRGCKLDARFHRKGRPAQCRFTTLLWCPDCHQPVCGGPSGLARHRKFSMSRFHRSSLRGSPGPSRWGSNLIHVFSLDGPMAVW